MYSLKIILNLNKYYIEILYKVLFMCASVNNNFIFIIISLNILYCIQIDQAQIS